MQSNENSCFAQGCHCDGMMEFFWLAIIEDGAVKMSYISHGEPWRRVTLWVSCCLVRRCPVLCNPTVPWVYVWRCAISDFSCHAAQSYWREIRPARQELLGRPTCELRWRCFLFRQVEMGPNRDQRGGRDRNAGCQTGHNSDQRCMVYFVWCVWLDGIKWFMLFVCVGQAAGDTPTRDNFWANSQARLHVN